MLRLVEGAGAAIFAGFEVTCTPMARGETERANGVTIAGPAPLPAGGRGGALHTTPTRMVIGQLTIRGVAGSPHMDVRSDVNSVNISSTPASRAARTADQVEI